MNHVLIIEDNNDINQILFDLLSDEYQITQAYSGTEGLLYFQQSHFDLILLDIMLPGKDGHQVLKEIRSVSQIPVLMLTAISDKKTVAQYLLDGANDYITKPFDYDEVRARVKVHLRQSQINSPTCLTYHQLELHPEDYSVKTSSTSVQLRKIEFDILHLLFEHPKQIYTKENLYEIIWQEPYIPGDNILNTHLSNIRKKLRQLDPDHEYIETIWGLGIRLKEVNSL